MEVLGVDDFHLLFITEPPEVEGRAPVKAGAPERKRPHKREKGRIYSHCPMIPNSAPDESYGPWKSRSVSG